MAPNSSNGLYMYTLGLRMNEAQSKTVWACIGAVAGTSLAYLLFNRTLKSTYEQCVPLQVGGLTCCCCTHTQCA